MKLLQCAHKAKHCAEAMANKSHYVYLAACTALDGHIILRVASGGCLILCILGQVLIDDEEEREA